MAVNLMFCVASVVDILCLPEPAGARKTPGYDTFASRILFNILDKV